jgi:hypothetical protein
VVQRPYGRLEARWLSQGKPTKLVRDKGVESFDEPPDEAPTQVPEEIEQLVQDDGADVFRAEDAWGEGDTFAPSWGDSFLDPPPGRGVPKAYESPRNPEPEV